jgi:Rrf2 family protein
MLEVSERAHYGLRAMTELAKAYGHGPVSLAHIAQIERLPAGYLEQLAMPLRRAGLIQGYRGAHGGYQLALAPNEVTVGAVVRALEGPVAPVECLQEEYAPGSCEREPVCLSQSVWQKMKETVEQMLDSITLAELCVTGGRAEAAFIPLSRIGWAEPREPIPSRE